MKNFLSFISILLIFSLFVMKKSNAKFTSVDEASLISTGGNTSLKTYNLKSENLYNVKKNNYIISGHYTYGEADDDISVEKWDILLKYERELSEKIGVFVAELIEANRFAGFARRYNSDLGVKYTFIKSDKNTTFTEIGYRYTVEKRKYHLPRSKDSKARVYVETKHKLSESTTGKFWGEYLPNFTESDDYLINFGPSLAVSLNKTFSLSISHLWNYDNDPAAENSKHDTTWTTGLIANF